MTKSEKFFTTAIGLTILLSFIWSFGFSFTPEEEAVFEKAKKSLEVHQNESSTSSPTPGSIGSNFVQTVNKTVPGGLLLSNTFSFYDSIGTFHVTGEVTNRSPDAMQSVSAVATFYDSAKNVVGTSTGYGYPSVLNPGVKGAFEISGPDSTQSKKISSFKVTLDGDLATIKPAALKLRVGNHYLGQFGFYKVAGDVTNTGTDPSSSIEVDGIFYNKLGKVIAITLTYPHRLT